MKKLLKSVVLTIALLLPFAAFAEEAVNGKTTGTVVNENENAPVAWVVSAEEAGEGEFAVTFEATIAEGFHGYSMTDMFSAPIIEFEQGAEVVGDVVEPIEAEEHADGFGGTSAIYYNNATYIYTVKADAGSKVKGFISVELSMGQMIEDVRLATQCKRPVGLCNRCGGMIPSPDQVLESIRNAQKGV